MSLIPGAVMDSGLPIKAADKSINMVGKVPQVRNYEAIWGIFRGKSVDSPVKNNGHGAVRQRSLVS